jgi:hypothetical protein
MQPAEEPPRAAGAQEEDDTGLDARNPARPGHLGAHHAPLVGRAAQDLPGPGRIRVCAGDGDVPIREQMGLECRRMPHGACRAESGLPVIIEHGSALPAVGDLVDQ